MWLSSVTDLSNGSMKNLWNEIGLQPQWVLLVIAMCTRKVFVQKYLVSLMVRKTLWCELYSRSCRPSATYSPFRRPSVMLRKMLWCELYSRSCRPSATYSPFRRPSVMLRKMLWCELYSRSCRPSATYSPFRRPSVMLHTSPQCGG